MDEIKKVMDEIPLPANLHERAQVGFKRKKSKHWILPSVAAALLLLLFTPAVLSNYFSIADFFQEKELKLSEIDESIVLVDGGSFTITLKQFVEQKENMRLVNALNNRGNSPSDEEIIDGLINGEIEQIGVKARGLHVSEQEILDYAMQTKEAFVNNENQDLNKIWTAMSANLNVSIDDYFTHPTTLKQYENLLLTQKLVEQFQSMDAYNQHIADLRKQYNVQINQELLE